MAVRFLSSFAARRRHASTAHAACRLFRRQLPPPSCQAAVEQATTPASSGGAQYQQVAQHGGPTCLPAGSADEQRYLFQKGDPLYAILVSACWFVGPTYIVGRNDVCVPRCR